MPETVSPELAAERLNKFLDTLQDQTPALAELIAAFRPLKVAQAVLAAGLPAPDKPLLSVDAAALAQGRPLASVADLLSAEDLDQAAYLRQAAARLLPALAEGLPNLAPEARALDTAVRSVQVGPEALEALLLGRSSDLAALAEAVGISAASLEFLLLELARPLLEKRAEALGPLLEGLDWRQGTCPVCGSLPALSYLQGSGGERYLRCSLCGHPWRFMRSACPVCGNEQQDTREFFFAEGREQERVELCRKCGKYLLSLDVRAWDQPPVWEVASLGLVHLDLLAQEKGLSPAAWTAWNRLG